MRLGLPLLAASLTLAASPPLPAGAEVTSITLEASDTSVRYGSRVRLTGKVAPTRAGALVTLEHARAPKPFAPVARTSSRADGRYAVWLRPRHTGRFRAVAHAGATSAPRRVVVAGVLVARPGRRHVLRGGRMVVRGVLRPGVRGRVVRLWLRTRSGWRTVDRARTTSAGRFGAVWRPSRLGTFHLRVRFAGDARNAAVTRRIPRRVNVYRVARASWYGPGFYGRRTACGLNVRPETVGVAHKTLRCGTRVTFRYRGRTTTARVIDRGPFVPGRDWDLAYATKQALRFDGVRFLWSTR